MRLVIDTHRHLGGSISSYFVWKTIQSRELFHIASTWNELKSAMTFVNGEPRGFYRFLDKFKVLDYIPWDKELVHQSIKAVCEQLTTEGVEYCWMDFSVNKYLQYIKMDKREIIQYIHELFQIYRPNKVGLILSLKYESPREQQEEYAKLIIDEDISKCLIGIDLVGDEAKFNAEFYREILRYWHDRGKMVRAHVAESQHAKNALDAITKLQVTNIAHGLKLLDHPEMIDLALKREITFDLGISSNYLTEVCNDEDYHPVIDMLKHGLKVTYGTDDPVQCSTTMQTEYAILRYWFGIEQSEIDKMHRVAAENSMKFDPRLTGHPVFQELQL